MSQFDPLIIFPLVWSLSLLLLFYYTLAIKIILPEFLGIKKIKVKKINYYSNFDKTNSFNIFFN